MTARYIVGLLMLVMLSASCQAQSGKLPKQFIGEWWAITPDDADTDTDGLEIYTRGRCGDDKEEQNRFEIRSKYAIGGEVQCPYTVVSNKLDKWVIKVRCTNAKDDFFHQQLWLVGDRLHVKTF
jgi:hypothetical protein